MRTITKWGLALSLTLSVSSSTFAQDAVNKAEMNVKDDVDAINADRVAYKEALKTAGISAFVATVGGVKIVMLDGNIIVQKVKTLGKYVLAVDGDDIILSEQGLQMLHLEKAIDKNLVKKFIKTAGHQSKKFAKSLMVTGADRVKLAIDGMMLRYHNRQERKEMMK